RRTEFCKRPDARRALRFRVRANLRRKAKRHCRDRSAARSRHVVDPRFRDRGAANPLIRDRSGLLETRALPRNRRQIPATSRFPTTSIPRAANKFRPGSDRATRPLPPAHSATGPAAKSQSKASARVALPKQYHPRGVIVISVTSKECLMLQDREMASNSSTERQVIGSFGRFFIFAGTGILVSALTLFVPLES